YWGDASRPVDTHVLNQDDLLGSVSMRVPVSNIVNTGDGPIKVWYVAFMDQPVTSPATTVTVKTTVPGGIDPDPVDTPYRNENLLAPTVSPNIVDATQAQNGVTVTVPLWENMATGDKLRVRWGTASVYHAPLQPGEVGAPVVVTIDQQTILAAGDSAQLMVTYDITDIVSQWSNNSMPAYAQVDASNAIFDAPYVVDARGGVIDVDKLGDKDATVLITVKAPIAVGDTIHLIFDGQSNAGLPVREESDAPVAAGDQFVHMAIGHSALVQVAPGTASLYYRVKRNGVDEGRSQSTFLNIAGTASTLAAPTVLEARGNTLDPRDTTNGAHVQIAPWSGMAVGDEV
ncbi:hypothetical protein, partial [Pandoraea horticolens]|uniref:hypothetical protein n=1 Tax=Pandoraea horticolens TaxID=2508298 RepID=UPI001C2DEABE